jgi:hypothetical protein
MKDIRGLLINVSMDNVNALRTIVFNGFNLLHLITENNYSISKLPL